MYPVFCILSFISLLTYAALYKAVNEQGEVNPLDLLIVVAASFFSWVGLLFAVAGLISMAAEKININQKHL